MSRRRPKPTLPFASKLVLHRWLLERFGVNRFARIAECLRNEALEGLDESNVHHFHHALCEELPAQHRPHLPDSVLLEYDQVLVHDLGQLNEQRLRRGQEPLVWKYFQYMALLFTEIYLECYFRDPVGLRKELNGCIVRLNAGRSRADRVPELDTQGEARPQLNKIAFWMATGSGKTLLMHAHILQYYRMLDRYGHRRDLNRILLLTPNEGLSAQHKREFETAGIRAEIFHKDGGQLYAGQTVEILEITKLKDETGDKTVAVDAFEGNNLVLVDEGHRGVSAGQRGAWIRYRNALCESGFSFEYSATFGQAVKGDRDLTDLYARTVLFDYSYQWFYSDGFGKDFRILNLDHAGDADAAWKQTYLTGCLLAFFQQQLVFHQHAGTLRPFNLERPLWIFVGGRVTASLSQNEASDILQVLRFLADYVSKPHDSARQIKHVLERGLETGTENVFQGRFSYLAETGMSPTDMFSETLSLLFNAPGGGAFQIENLKGVPGELALRVGENAPFGVVNVGDDVKLAGLCANADMDVAEREFAGSLFHEIDRSQSTVNVLVGARKFVEGWSSWRVSTMGLMNIGRTEGAQIIQLFGRGVRLKGLDLCLKRSAALPAMAHRPAHIGLLETLQVFGIQADYMAHFRGFLEEEGLSSDGERIEMHIPIVARMGSQRLRTIRVSRDIGGDNVESTDAFRRCGPLPVLGPPDRQANAHIGWLQQNPVVLNWYPKIQILQSEGEDYGPVAVASYTTFLRKDHVAFLDIDRLYFELERFRMDRGWHNLSVTRGGIEALLNDNTWYSLQIPESALIFDSVDKIRLWQEIALALLRKYAERYHAFRRREWEMPHLEYDDLGADDPNFPIADEGTNTLGYRVILDTTQADLVCTMQELKAWIEEGRSDIFHQGPVRAICFDRHLYQPLLLVEAGAVKISPIPLNRGEFQFVEDLKRACTENQASFAGKELFLLRNQSRGKGIGFFEAGNFHPDFILWLLDGERQHIVFIDPKGMRHMGLNDPKLRFSETVKEIEQRLGDSRVILDSFIVSSTSSQEMTDLWGISKDEMKSRHIVFQNEDRHTYIETLFQGMGM